MGNSNERPKELAYSGGGIPSGYKLEERYNLGLLIAGPTLFALAYVITVASAVERVDQPPSIGGGIGPKPAPWHALYVPIPPALWHLLPMRQVAQDSFMLPKELPRPSA